MTEEPDPATSDRSARTSAVGPLPGAEFTYLGVVSPLLSPTRIIGVIRCYEVDGRPDYQIFTRSLVWERTPLPWLHRVGRTDKELVDITPQVAQDFVDRIRARGR